MTAESGHVPSHAQHRTLQPKRTESALSRLADVIDPGDWVQRAACAGQDPDRWWPDSPNGRDPSRVELDTMVAIRTCNGCPVRRECAAYALATKAVSGIWGGVLLSDSAGNDYAGHKARRAAARQALREVAGA